MLFPGVLFFFGLYFEERASRETIQAGLLFELTFVALVSLAVHATGFLIASFGCNIGIPCINLEYVFAALQMQGANNISVADLSANIGENVGWIFVYLFVTSTVGFIAGWRTGVRIINGSLPRLAVHSWIYDLVASDDHYIIAHVLTHLKYENRAVVYRGFLEEYYFTKDGKISYLVLSQCSRYYLVLEKDAIETSAIEHWSPIGETHGVLAQNQASVISSIFVIEGDDISNVVFDRVKLPDTEEALADVIQQGDDSLQPQA
ncbi:MAG: hypothetical protein HY308_16800 [Gammaproteobacteria bacterium]|nr:hypothetical protein [Gammaproteobacteria bacterium]